MSAFGVGLGLFDHLFDLVIRQTARGLNGDLLFLVGALVLGLHRHDAVGVDVKGDFDLGHAARGGRDGFKVELAKDLVVGGHFAFALEHADRHGVLIVFGGREHLRLFGRDRGVTVDQAGEHAAQRFDAQRQGASRPAGPHP